MGITLPREPCALFGFTWPASLYQYPYTNGQVGKRNATLLCTTKPLLIKMNATKGGAPALTAQEAAVQLQDRLHYLLSRLNDAVELIKTWPEAKGDDASVHVESTTKLINYVRNVVSSVERVELVVKDNPSLKKKLQDCAIPLDLLDLLDHGQGGGLLNPDCFVRGLLREALGQLAGLKRRKLALELLGSAVQTGLNKKIRQQQAAAAESLGRRTRDETENEEDQGQPPAKRQKITETET